ncbi:hypothetical protein FF011L_15940 [Roseimaritima multifibrata]|uniref:Uncharacterized protein n=1 Tax=Roseimaritima multifibrata TaxID=1930274 RepID=A0A517MD87_9BACT|nr:hypothetical protein [Roseimaritima multifibrata]QDS92845.1 hypothetical protein FF011L_15940 [Roseimaritima multifibrata]
MQSNVRDLEVLQRLDGGLLKWAHAMDVSVQEIRHALQHAQEWITSDQPAYWKQQTTLAERDLNAALDDLQQKQSTTRPGDRAPATEAKKRVATAKNRMAFCREKQLRCRHHRLQIESALNAATGPIGNMQQTLDTGIPRARSDLQQMLSVLQQYSQTKLPPVDPEP